MTYQPTQSQIARLKKHERSISSRPAAQTDLAYLAGADLPASSLAGLNRPLWQLLPAAVIAQVSLWRERVQARQRLSELSRSALADLGIDPGQAAFEAERPFWQAHELRRADRLS
jgi:uncharacterized protein YjiS (DUF1127 family)